jgi:antitoxin YobK
MNEKLKKCFDLIDKNMGRCFFENSISDDLIENSEDMLGLNIPLSYKLFLKHYGQGTIGCEEIYGLIESHFNSFEFPDTVRLTLDDRKYGLKNNYLVIGSSGYGPSYVLDCEGKNEVFLWHGDDVYEKLFDSFEDFLMERIEWGLESGDDDEDENS